MRFIKSCSDDSAACVGLFLISVQTDYAVDPG